MTDGHSVESAMSIQPKREPTLKRTVGCTHRKNYPQPQPIRRNRRRPYGSSGPNLGDLDLELPYPSLSTSLVAFVV